ncbi:hypothetical protein MG293_019198 [Ovis ammon polii]|uniref:Orexin receptor type 2 n=1 Tax=Ovis ammon polii TaxID=230172 RepID=A0AAD4XYW8_OVIAM|nr:hypothetical protein MG293_019198 [Ovis ammon polii]
MSGTKLEDSPPCRNWSSAPELNETQEPFLNPTDYDDEEFLRYLWREYLHPKEYEWVLIAGYIIVFVVALIGNVLVCVAVWKNHHMRTVTNYFIVNLSLADVLVTITCLPATLVVDITETWFFGQSLCKVIPYLQTVSVSVSVLTLSCIALDRWYAICHPLMFKSTAKRARNSIVIIWIVSCVIMIPQAIVMECSTMLPGEIYPKMYHICFFLVTYMAPLCLMVLAYLQIFRKLWCRQIPGTSSVVQRKWKALQPLSQPRGPGQQTKSRISAVAAEIKQIRARRKTARMLMVVLLVFAICYLPISILNVLKRVFGMFTHTEDRETVYAWFTFAHWLVYANSAANPIIYNFLSGKFREEFKAAFSCCCLGVHHRQEDRLARGRTSTESRKSLTTQISNFDNVSKLSEQVVLTSISTLPAANGAGPLQNCTVDSNFDQNDAKVPGEGHCLAPSRERRFEDNIKEDNKYKWNRTTLSYHGSRGVQSCLEVAEVCVGDALCNAQLALYLKACSADGELCDVKHCQAAIRFFYQNMPFNIAQMLAFCDCAPADEPCQQSREALHSRPCAVNRVPTPTCLDVIHSCQDDELCRRRYRTFQAKCWQHMMRKCHEDETCIGTLSKQDLTCSGSDDCKAAYIGTLGTVLQVQCTCRTITQSEESVCEIFQHMLHRKSCFNYLTLSKVKGIALQKGNNAKEITLSGFHPPFNGEVIYAVICMTATCGILLLVMVKLRQELFISSKTFSRNGEIIHSLAEEIFEGCASENEESNE